MTKRLKLRLKRESAIEVTRIALENEKPPVVTLKALCVELKLDPRIAREKLRIAAREGRKFPELAKAHKPRGAWEWVKGSEAEKQARAALTT